MARSLRTTSPDVHGNLPGSGKPETISALTGVRALAALWVVVWHLKDPIYTAFPPNHLVDTLVTNGLLGVDVFFVLSGFVISHNYAQRFVGAGRRAYRDYLVARFARIYPVHLFTLLVTGVLVAYAAAIGSTLNSSWNYSVGTFVGNLFLLQAIPGIDPWNTPSWSVSCEMAAYLVFPLAAGMLVRARWRAAALLAIAVLIVQTGLLLLLSDSVIYVYAVNWVRIAGEFTAGSLLWVVWRHRVRPHWTWDLTAIGALTAAGVLLFIAPLGQFHFYLAVPFLALAVLSTAASSGWLRAVLSSGSMQWGGRISYSLYLIHLPVLLVLFKLFPPRELGAESAPEKVVLVGAYILGPVAAAAVAYHVIEEPARRWLRRRVGGPDVGAPTSGFEQGRDHSGYA